LVNKTITHNISRGEDSEGEKGYFNFVITLPHLQFVPLL
jgi:hypothetical protein